MAHVIFLVEIVPYSVFLDKTYLVPYNKKWQTLRLPFFISYVQNHFTTSMAVPALVRTI